MTAEIRVTYIFFLESSVRVVGVVKGQMFVNDQRTRRDLGIGQWEGVSERERGGWNGKSIRNYAPVRNEDISETESLIDMERKAS